MPLVINSNIAALNSQRQLVKSGDDLMQAMERLSSGKRINTAADDAAGLAISNRMTSQVMGLNQAVRNANDGISLIQTAEGALDETTNILQRIRELSIQSANGIYADGDRATLDAEAQQLLEELDRIAATTSFNGQKLLDGTLGDVDLQIGSEANQVINFSISAMTTDKLGLGTTSSDISGARTGDLLNLDAAAGAPINIGDGDVLINNQSIGAFNGGTDTFQDLIDNINVNVAGVTAEGYNIAEAGGVGTGAIADTDVLTISVFDVDGDASARTDFKFTSSNSLDELVSSINTKTGGLLTASVSDAGRLVLSNDTGAALALTYENVTSNGDSLGSVLGYTNNSIADQGGVNSADGEYIAGGTDAALFTGALSLSADDGGVSISINAGPQGSPADLANLGFQESSGDGTITGLGNNDTVPAGTVDFSQGLESGDLTINGTVIAATINDSLQGAIDIINTATDQTGVVAASIATQAFDENTSIAATELVANDTAAYAFNAADTITINGVVSGAYGAPGGVADVATAINLISDDTGVTAFVDDNDALHLFSPGPIVMTNGSGLVSDFGDLEDAFNVGTDVASATAVQGASLSTAGASDIVINGQVVALTDLGDLSQIVLDVNTSEAQTGVHAEIDDNGELSLSSNSNISIQLGTTRSAMTAAHALGVGDLITDGAGGGPDGALDATSFTVGAGIKLTSINSTTISIDGNASAQTATGLLNQNTDLSAIATGSAIASLSIATQAGAQAAIDPIDNALETINATRSEMGAVTNRLDFTISNLMNVSENTAAARSRIVDADFAAETANLSRAQVLQQASQAMLAQANAAPQRVLQLLNS